MATLLTVTTYSTLLLVVFLAWSTPVRASYVYGGGYDSDSGSGSSSWEGYGGYGGGYGGSSFYSSSSSSSSSSEERPYGPYHHQPASTPETPTAAIAAGSPDTIAGSSTIPTATAVSVLGPATTVGTTPETTTTTVATTTTTTPPSTTTPPLCMINTAAPCELPLNGQATIVSPTLHVTLALVEGTCACQQGNLNATIFPLSPTLVAVGECADFSQLCICDTTGDCYSRVGGAIVNLALSGPPSCNPDDPSSGCFLGVILNCVDANPCNVTSPRTGNTLQGTEAGSVGFVNTVVVTSITCAGCASIPCQTCTGPFVSNRIGIGRR